MTHSVDQLAPQRFSHGVLEGNYITKQLDLVHGAEDIHVRSNVFRRDGTVAIEIAPYSNLFQRGVKDAVIANNTIVNYEDGGTAFVIWSGQDDLKISNNLHVSPEFHAGYWDAKIVDIHNNNLSGKSFDNNIWADAEINRWASGSMWVDGLGWLDNDEWNSRGAVSNDIFNDVSIDNGFRPNGNSVAADSGTAVAGVLVDFYGNWRDAEGDRTVGAVEL